jgi:hypothetical protein
MSADGAPDESSAMLPALEKVRGEYAAELRYRRLVAWIACLFVGLLLIMGAIGAYLHRDRVATLERDLAAAQAIADERAEVISDLRDELARERRRPPRATAPPRVGDGADAGTDAREH